MPLHFAHVERHAGFRVQEVERRDGVYHRYARADDLVNALNTSNVGKSPTMSVHMPALSGSPPRVKERFLREAYVLV